MRVFVTGGAGYIGSICVEELLNAGHQVTTYDNLSEGHRAAVDLRAVFVQGDLADEALLQQSLRASGAEVIMHFAANSLVGESMTNPGKYFGNNVGNGVKLLNAAVAQRVRKFVFSSTCATYGYPEWLPMTEDLPQRPINPYGESKLMFERMLSWYHQLHGLEFVALRYFNAAGASARFGEAHRIESHLIPNIFKVALGQKPHCEIFGTDYETPDGTCIRDYIHILDLADAHMRAMEPGQQGFYNLGTGEGFSVRQVIDTCRKVSGRDIKALERPRRAGDAPRLVAGANKARRELGWTPRFLQVEEIVASVWAWQRQHPNGYPE